MLCAAFRKGVRRWLAIAPESGGGRMVAGRVAVFPFKFPRVGRLAIGRRRRGKYAPHAYTTGKPWKPQR
jgi:hypothetical protein